MGYKPKPLVKSLQSGLHHFGHDHNKETMSDLGCVGGLDQKIRPPGLVLEGEHHRNKHEITKRWKPAHSCCCTMHECFVRSRTQHDCTNFRLARWPLHEIKWSPWGECFGAPVGHVETPKCDVIMWWMMMWQPRLCWVKQEWKPHANMLEWSTRSSQWWWSQGSMRMCSLTCTKDNPTCN